jgi:hypothetical protein
MAENKEINFNLLKINSEQFAVFNENYIPNEIINLNTNLSFGLNQEDKVFLVTPKYTFQMNDKPFMTIQISCFFKIEDETWNSFIKKKEIIFPKGFVAHMAMITVGTSRGILHSKTEGTQFNELILPTLNVAEMVPEDVTFSI